VCGGPGCLKQIVLTVHYNPNDDPAANTPTAASAFDIDTLEKQDDPLLAAIFEVFVAWAPAGYPAADVLLNSIVNEGFVTVNGAATADLQLKVLSLLPPANCGKLPVSQVPDAVSWSASLLPGAVQVLAVLRPLPTLTPSRFQGCACMQITMLAAVKSRGATDWESYDQLPTGDVSPIAKVASIAPDAIDCDCRSGNAGATDSSGGDASTEAAEAAACLAPRIKPGSAPTSSAESARGPYGNKTDGEMLVRFLSRASWLACFFLWSGSVLVCFLPRDRPVAFMPRVPYLEPAPASCHANEIACTSWLYKFPFTTFVRNM
jgi:hypothetical protein